MAKENNTIIGTFDGECADANITNLNGLDITREVWENVFNSDEYKQAIEQGWYIGFLGHPEDPNCMDFEHACIVMTDGYIDDDNKIYGAFNLIDTPVGRVVKSFIDAGVQFGISVRGAGDIENNSVDPDTFVFRGFDLVTFPAYPNSIPEFQEIAASTDLAKRAKYRKVCAAIKANVNDLPLSSIELIQPQFAPQSKEYEMLESQKKELEAETLANNAEFSDTRLDALMQMYLEEKDKNRELEAELKTCISESKKITSQTKRAVLSFKQIAKSQQEDLLDELDDTIQANQDLEYEIRRLRSELKTSVTASRKMESDIISLEDELAARSKENKKLQSTITKLNDELDDEINASTQLHAKINTLEDKYNTTSNKLARTSDKLATVQASLSDAKYETKDKVDELNETNLIYKSELEDLRSQLSSKDKVIASLRTELAETVGESEDAMDKTSNLEAQNKILTSRIQEMQQLVADYQEAYATIYAHAIGVEFDALDISANASVSELKKSIQNIQPQLSNNSQYVEADSDDGIVTA